MARAKKDRQVVVNKAYFDLIEKKAGVFDELFAEETGISVSVEALKAAAKVTTEWDKVIGSSDLSGSEAYVAPKE